MLRDKGMSESLGGAPSADGTASLVSMRSVSKAFGDNVVLDDIDLDIKPNERVALIGPSGSGKTTILRLTIGLTKPDAGTIMLDGTYLWHEVKNGQLVPAGERHARKARRAAGMVFQQFNLFPHMSALVNVREPMVQALKIKRDEAEDRAAALLTEVGLQEHMQKNPAQLSGGQQQRVAIARSLGLQPKVMLFDEITSALDPELVGEVLRVVRRLAQETNMSMLIVTHEISFAADIADRVLMFDAGRIIEEGPPEQVLKAPEHPRTKQFLRAILER
jgi:polar amino acid transport system ATP-binding protein